MTVPTGDSASSAADSVARSASSWDLEVKPHLAPYFAYAAAFAIAAAHIGVGFALKIGSSGVIFQTADQVAIALLGDHPRRCWCCCSPALGCVWASPASACETY